jgi:putative membrane protein
MLTLLHFLVVAATFIVLSRVLPGFHVNGWGAAIFGAIILAVVNAIIRPILFVVTLPITILTFGLFLLIVNAIVLKITSAIVPGLGIDGWGPAIIGGIVFSIIGMIWKAITHEDQRTPKMAKAH